jgi:hypothetical protein
VQFDRGRRVADHELVGHRPERRLLAGTRHRVEPVAGTVLKLPDEPK